jgi:hypothetical protein
LPLTPKETGFSVLDWVTRTLLPAVMDAAGKADIASLIAELPTVEDRKSIETASSVLGHLHADPWEDVSVPRPSNDIDKELRRIIRWSKADRKAAQSLLSSLGLEIAPEPDSGRVIRLMSGQPLWVRMAHAAGEDAQAWVQLWDVCSRAYFTAMRWATGQTAELIYGHDPDSMIDPELALGAALREMTSTLKAGHRARFLPPPGTGEKTKWLGTR